MSPDTGTLRDDNIDSVLLQMVEGLVGSRDDGSIGAIRASQWTVTDVPAEEALACGHTQIFTY